MRNLVQNRHPVYVLVAVVACVCAARGAFHIALAQVKLPKALFQPAPESIVLTDRNGVPLRERRVEERFSHELNRSDIPEQFVRAILAAEDKRFFRHRGVDWLATGRALVDGIYRGRLVSGASTITQQLIKISEHRRRNWPTKIVQTIEALALERRWSKDDIFTAYVNRLDFGNLNIGLVSAADFYFAKAPSELSDAEAAFLAGLPKNPRRLNPHTAPSMAHRRQQTVLRRMRDMGLLNAGQYEIATAEPLRIRPPGRLFRAPHFVDLVLRDLPPDATRVRTTLDLELTDRVTAFVRDRLSQLRDHNARNAAAVVIDNRSGDVLALVGSENYFASGTGQVNGAWTPRSAGSTLKPFTYLLAFEAWPNAGERSGGCGYPVRSIIRLLFAGKLQSALLRPCPLPNRAG